MPSDFLPDPQQLATFLEFKALLWPTLETDSDRVFCTDFMLRRYLRARDFKLKEAEKMIQGTLKWRKEAQPSQILPEHIEGVREFFQDFFIVF